MSYGLDYTRLYRPVVAASRSLPQMVSGTGSTKPSLRRRRRLINSTLQRFHGTCTRIEIKAGSRKKQRTCRPDKSPRSYCVTSTCLAKLFLTRRIYNWLRGERVNQNTKPGLTGIFGFGRNIVGKKLT